MIDTYRLIQSMYRGSVDTIMHCMPAEWGRHDDVNIEKRFYMKETRRAFMHRHPIMYAIMTALSFLLILYFTAHVTQGIEIPGYGGLLLREESALMLTMLVLAGFGMLQEIPWEQDNFMDTLKAGGFVLLLDALLLQYERILMIENDALPWTQILIFLAFIFLVGLLEETVFRGIIEETLIRSFRPTALGRLKAAYLTGLLFGLAHVINMSWAADPMAVVFQMVQNVVIGIYLSLIYARARNVLAMIFLHAFYDFTSLMMSGIYGIGSMQQGVEAMNATSLWVLLIYLGPIVYLTIRILVDAHRQKLRARGTEVAERSHEGKQAYA